MMVSCSCSHKNADNLTGYVTSNTAMRKGPFSSCALVSNELQGAHFAYSCYVTNSNGTKWTYGEITEDQEYGWILNSHLSNGGSKKSC